MEKQAALDADFHENPRIPDRVMGLKIALLSPENQLIDSLAERR